MDTYRFQDSLHHLMSSWNELVERRLAGAGVLISGLDGRQIEGALPNTSTPTHSHNSTGTGGYLDGDVHSTYSDYQVGTTTGTAAPGVNYVRVFATSTPSGTALAYKRSNGSSVVLDEWADPHNLFGGSHSDVDTTQALADGMGLFYKQSSNKWEPRSLTGTASGGGITVSEQDGSPSVSGVSEIEYATGTTVTDLGSGKVRVTPPAGSGPGTFDWDQILLAQVFN
jgi:hypothetical protein